MIFKNGGPRFGLDLGRASVKLVRCDKSGARGAERRIDSSLQGEQRHAALVQAVREVCEELGAKPGAQLNVGVPRAEAIVRRLILPRVPLAELEQMVQFQASKALPFDLSEMVVTWSVVEDPEAKPEAGQVVMFAGVRKQALESMQAVVDEAGYRAACLEVSTQAAARALALLGPQDVREALLVEVGQSSSDVIVLERGRLLFSRSASVGCGDDPSAGTQWLTRLTQEVLRSLVAARTEDSEETENPFERTGPPTALLLAGGGASQEALREAMADQVGVEPSVLSGLEDAPPEVGARFVVARGLADPRQVPGVPALDLARRAELELARTTRNKLIGAIAGAVFLVVALAVGVRVQLSGLEERVAALQQEESELAPDMRRAGLLEEELEAVREWDRQKGRELELLLAITQALPEGERVYLTQFRWQVGRSLRLTGRAKDWDSVGNFLTKLEDHPLIAKASLDSVRRPREKKTLGVDFSAQATLTGAGTP